jgi:hypothetical protein
MVENVSIEDPIVAQWIGVISKNNTKSVYLQAIEKFIAYTGKSPRDLILEAETDAKQSSLLDRQSIVEQRIIGFSNWLKNKAPKDQRRDKGYTLENCDSYTGAISDFYCRFGFDVGLKGASQLAERNAWKPEHIKKRNGTDEVQRHDDHGYQPRQDR